MRSKPEKPKSNMGKVAIVLAILAVLWLAIGTALIFSFSYWIKNSTIASAPKSEEIEDIQEEDESDADDFDDEGTDLDDDMKDDQEFYDDDEINEKYSDDSDDDSDDEDPADDEDEADDDDEDDDDEDGDTGDYVQTFTVDAWDGFAAVRTGRGTGYSEVGRLNNGEKVKVKDLENGWYEIASGKWKGYYLHKSSLK